MLRPTIANEPIADEGAARGVAQRADRGAPEPALPRCGRRDAARGSSARRRQLLPPLPRPASHELEGLAAQCRSFLDSTESLYEDSMDRALREQRRRRPRRGRALRPRTLLPRLELGRGLPRRPDAAGPARHARRPRNRPRRAVERPPRRRGAPDQVAACFLRPDRGPRQGDARDPAAWAGRTTGARSSTRRATPSTSPSPRPNLKMEEKRLGDNAVTEGWAMLFEHLIDDPAWLTRHAQRPAAAGRSRPRGRSSSSSSSAATGRSCSTSSSSTRPPIRRRCAAATSSCSAMRSRSSRAARTTSPTSTPGYYCHRPTSAPGRSRRSSRPSCARSSAATGSAAARRARS